jgi:hypothetical protein
MPPTVSVVRVTSLSSRTFPLLIGTGISVAIGYLNPCGLDSIHLHNRADELVTLVQGTSLKTGFVLEDGYGELSVEF